MFRITSIIFTVLLLEGCSSRPVAKNHVFFIVDGMGPSHITGARLYNGGPEAHLQLEKMPYTGMVKTYSSDNFVTDSAAAATAMASGRKTYNGAIGVTDPKKDPKGRSLPLTTVVDRAQQAGKSIGLISTARITHATPAAYYAHVPHRDLEESIAEQLLESGIDIIIGGGRHFFTGKNDGGRRKDKKNLFNQFIKKNYQVVTTSKEFQSLPLVSEKKLVALLADDHLPYDLDREDQPSLKELVEFAIHRLSQNPKGYFLVVEAARVDHASHRNLSRYALGDMLAFDLALKSVFTKTETDTLIVTTSDHETGGLALNGYAPHEAASGEKILKNYNRNPKLTSANHGFISWASGPGFKSPPQVSEENRNFQHKAAYPAAAAYHTAVDVPVMARGPGAEQFTGFFNNTELVHKVISIMGLEPIKTK